MLYKDYQNARDSVWDLLIDLKITELPIKVSTICHSLGITLSSIEKAAPDQHLQNTQNGPVIDGISRFVGERPVILYNADSPTPRIRFTIAHELGHFMLGHMGTDLGQVIKTPILFRQDGEPENAQESAANVFASRLLAPACVLRGLGIEKANDIAHICDISNEAAAYRMQRMQQLYAREAEFLDNRGYSCFLLSPKEKQVFEQFRRYIGRNKL